MPSPLPVLRFADWAALQDQIDQDAVRGLPELLARKRRRQLLSPHGFLRGSAPLFYRVLAARPDLWAGPPGEGWLVGDMHLENVGAYRDERGEVVFDLNDFDDATWGPLRLDVLRLLTSALLVGRGLPPSAPPEVTGAGVGPEALALAAGLLESYCQVRSAALTDAGSAGEALPPPIVRLLERVRKRPLSALLDARAPEVQGRRRLLRGERYLDLPEPAAAAVPELLAAYLRVLGSRAPAHAPEWRIDDSAQRVAGTGSLGCLRIAVVVRTRSGEARLLDFKQAGPPSVLALRSAGPVDLIAPAERVVLAARALPAATTELLAPVQCSLGSLVGRKLRPQEDRLDLAKLANREELRLVLRAIGARLGRGHARALAAAPAGVSAGAVPHWDAAAQAQLLDQAVELCGLHEGIALAYARRIGAP